VPVAGPLKERLGAAKTLAQKRREQEMALELKELESQTDIKKEVMLQKLKNQSKGGDYSASMRNSLEAAAHAMAGTGAIYIDGKLHALGKNAKNPVVQQRFDKYFKALELRAAQYQARGFGETAAVGMAKRDMRAVKHKKETLVNDDPGNITEGEGVNILPTPTPTQ
jgi:hypothetical protein